MKAIPVFFILLLSLNALADVEHIFQANTPAKASEVNENFESLDSSIITIEQQVTTNSTSIANTEQRVTGTESRLTNTEGRLTLVEQNGAGPNCATTGLWWSAVHEIGYTNSPSTTGQEINLNGKLYRIVSVPFVEFETGDKYTVKFPTPLNNTGVVSGNISTSHNGSDVNCSQANIAGYPAYNLTVTEQRTINFYNNGTTASKSQRNYYFGLSLKINQTVLNVPFSVNVLEQSVVVNTGDYDFTDDLDQNLMSHEGTALQSLDDLIDYIQITKAP